MNMVERVKAWQCIGCGRIEESQGCIGVCSDRRVEFVYASDYDESVALAAHARSEVERLTGLVRQLATTTPRADGWERTYRELQRRARETLGISVAPTKT